MMRLALSMSLFVVAAAAASADDIGVPACDEFLAKYETLL